MRRVLVALTLAFATMASAQHASSNAAASRLIKVMGIQASWERSETAYVATMIRTNPRLNDYRDILQDWVAHTLDWDIISPRLVTHVAAAFTAAELDSIVAFYSTPLGRRWVTEREALNTYVVQLEVELSTQYRPELLRRLRARAAALHKPDPLASD